VVTTENSDWATNCPEYKVTAVQISPAASRSRWQEAYAAHDDHQHALLDGRSRGAAE
jgi:formate dehydrogenase major subunit